MTTLRKPEMTRPSRILVSLLVIFGVFAVSTGPTWAAGKSEELVTNARFTIEHVAQNPDFKIIPETMSKAKAVLIFPLLIKGAFIVGGEGGSGVLLARDKSGNWSYPAFYTMGSGSIGFQIGGQASEAVFIIMTDKGLQSVIDHQVKLGADVGIAAGPFGAGAEASTTSNLNADIVAYTKSKGLFAGISLEGAVVAERQDWNEQYYGKGATPRAIVVEGRYANPNADKLRAALAGF